MNSLRRPHHIRLHDLSDFIHSYDPASGNRPEEWAKQVSAGLKQGCLIFLLEPVAAPFGLTSLTRKDDDESFRVTELGLVVRLEDNKAMVLSAASNSYELRFLVALMEEKARKALLDHRKFCFVLAKPAVQFTADRINEIERLANHYVQGGSRRDFMEDEADPEHEPVVAILKTFGARLRWPESSKQPLDLGSICHLLFTPEGRQPDSNRTELKANFVPVTQLINSPVEAGGHNPPIQASETPSSNEFNLLSSWGQAPPSSEVAANSSLFKRLTEELAKPQQQEDPLSLLNRHSPAEPAVDTFVESSAKTDNAPQPIVSAQSIAADKNDEVYHHISEAISGLLDTEMDLKKPNKAEQSAKWVTSQIAARREEIEQKRGNDRRNLSPDFAAENLLIEKQLENESVDLKLESPAPISELESTAPVDFALLDNVSIENESVVFPAGKAVPTKLDDFQEPKVVMNEMASLMNKLESQVARAAKKLTTRTAAIEQQLTDGMATILTAVTQENKDTEAQLVIHGDSLSKQFESLYENLKAEVAEKSTLAREQILEKRTAQQKLIEESEQEHHEALTDALNQNRTQFGQLVQDQESQLKSLFEEETKKLHQQMIIINNSLQETAGRFTEYLSRQLDDFEKRISEEKTIILDNLDNNTNMLGRNILISCQHGLEKLKKTKNEFEINLKHLVDTTEIALARQIRIAQIEFFLPRLKEHKQLVETTMQEMEETFADKLLSQSEGQLEGLESSLASARAQLKDLMNECLTKLDIIGRNQQSGLEELFVAAAHSLGQNTESLLRLLKQAEQEITDGDAVCKKLAETYSLDTDPAVTSLRQNISNRVDSLKAQIKSELESAVNNDCATLEELIRNQHTKLNARRAELAQRVHFASDHGLQRIRAAIHDAFNAIQSERETYME